MAKPRVKGAAVNRGDEFVAQLNNAESDFQIPKKKAASKIGRPKHDAPSKRIVLTLRPEMCAILENLRDLFDETPSHIVVRALACLASSDEVKQRKQIKSVSLDNFNF